MHGLYRAERGLGGGDGQGKGCQMTALRMITRLKSDMEGLRGSCPKEGGAVGGLYCVRALAGV